MSKDDEDLRSSDKKTLDDKKEKSQDKLKNTKSLNLSKFRKSKVFKVASYFIVFFIGYAIGAPTEEAMLTNSEVESVMSQNTAYKEDLEKANDEIATLKDKVEDAKPWFEMKEKEQKEIAKANEEKRLAEEEAKKKAEEEEQRKKEEEEKKGYDTGITYSQLARTPDEYKGKKVKFSGKVLQVMEGDGEVQIRLAVGGNYNNVIYAVYSSSLVESRVLEDDYITIMGLSSGLLTYTSTMGGEITIPSMLVQKIEQ